MQKISKLIATVFFIGYSPLASGTVASLAALFLYILIHGNIIAYFSLTAFLLIAGFWSSSKAGRFFTDRDPSEIVIDEFSSLFLVYLFIPFNPKLLITGFLLFRFFDIFKIPPIKKLESLPGGFGIMCDDIASALLANIILHGFLFSSRAFFS